MKIICLEGLDKSGKATTASFLTKSLSDLGYKVAGSEFHRYDTPTGQLIRKFLLGEYNVPQQAIECIMAADKYAQLDWFKQLEEEGYDVLILDRYIASQIVYGVANGITSDFLLNILEDLPQPDFEFFLDITVEESMSRKGQHGENDKYESDKVLLQKVRNYYHMYMKIRQDSQEAAVIDGMRTVEEIQEEVLSRTLSLLEKKVH